MMKDAELREMGRRIVYAIVAATLSMSVGIIGNYILLVGTDRLIQQVARLGMTVWLSVHLMRGSRVARWLAIVLYALGGVFGIASLFASRDFDLTTVVLGSWSASYLVSALALFLIPSVRAHFGVRPRRRARRLPRRVPRTLEGQRPDGSDGSDGG